MGRRKDDLIATPRVYVIGTQSVDWGAVVQFLDDEGHRDKTWPVGLVSLPGEALPEISGRLCYMSFGPGGRPHAEYIRHLLECGHGSVLEHAVVTFILTGVSRTLTHELVRHRAGWAYSQLSQRYVDEHAAQFILPPALAGRDTDRVGLRDEWRVMAEDARDNYRRIVERLGSILARERDESRLSTALRKVLRGAARSVLPGCTETKICCTVNARALRHFLELRANVHADDEIREVALLIHDAVRPHWPDLLGDFRRETSGDGRDILVNDYKKV
jgi:thymidylate synthase (FAD)